MTVKAIPLDWTAALAVEGKQIGVSQSEHARSTLFQAIVQGRVPPGQHLSEQPIADAIGVSRISVRDAIRQLEAAGLVSIYPHRGAYTVRLDPQDIEEIFSLRTSLEVLAIKLVARNASRTDLARLEDVVDKMRTIETGDDRYSASQVDTEFHSILMEVSGHARAFDAWKRMNAQITMAVYQAASYYEALGSLADRHVAIIDTLKTGDTDKAEEAIVAHIIHGSHLLLKAVGRQRLLSEEPPRRHHTENITQLAGKGPS